MLNVLCAVSAICARSSFNSRKSTYAVDVAAVFRLMTALVSRGVAVESILQFLRDENSELRHLCGSFSSISNHCVIYDALGTLCIATLKTLYASPVDSCHLACGLFSTYVYQSNHAVAFVSQAIHILGVNGSHMHMA